MKRKKETERFGLRERRRHVICCCENPNVFGTDEAFAAATTPFFDENILLSVCLCLGCLCPFKEDRYYSDGNVKGTKCNHLVGTPTPRSSCS